VANATPSLNRPGAISLDSLSANASPEALGDSPLLDMLSLFARRWRLFIVTTVVVFASGLTIILLQPPMYRADSAVMFDPRSRQVFTFTPVVSGYNENSQTLEIAMATEVKLVLSRSVVDPVIEQLGLAADPEFARTTKPLPARILAWLRPHLPWPAPPWLHTLIARIFPDRIASGRAGSPVLAIFASRLKAELQGHSTVLNIAFTSRDPAKAAAIANAIAASYVQLSVKERTGAVMDALAALTKRSDELRKDVDDAELAVADYRASAHLMEGSGGNVSAAQVTELSTEIVRARTDLALAQARLVALNGGGGGSSGELASPVIQRLRESLADAAAKLSNDQALYGANYPAVRAETAQIAALRQQIQTENSLAIQAQQAVVNAALARVRLLSGDLAEVWKQAADDSRANVRLRELELNASVKHSLYEAQLRRVQEVSLQLGAAQPYAKVISAAEIPRARSSPDLHLLVPALGIVSIGLGAAIAMAAELGNKTFNSTRQVERIFGEQTIETLPRVESRRSGALRLLPGRGDGRYASPYVEAIDALRVRVAALGPRQKTVLFSSALPQEGKTTAAIAFARREALAARKVLLIDADLRRASVHGTLGGHREGLTDILLDGKSFDELCQRDPVSGLTYLAAGRYGGSPIDLLSSNGMQDLLHGCEARFDRIVIDSAPVIAVPDARVLTSLAAFTIYLVRWRSTPRRLACLGFEILRSSGGTLIGPIFVQVDGDDIRYAA
jgi:polysaccharide biosynthesis transport protein